MKTVRTVLCLAAVAACSFSATGQSTSGSKTPDTKTQNKGPSIPPVTIPKDAVRNPDGTFSWTDKDGSKWIFRQTPFGVAKSPAAVQSEAPPAKERSSAQTQANTKAVESGDVVRFEKTTPFGTTKWEKKKSDLTDEEREILARQNAKPASQKSE